MSLYMSKRLNPQNETLDVYPNPTDQKCMVPNKNIYSPFLYIPSTDIEEL